MKRCEKMSNGRFIISSHHKAKVLDYEKDWFMINYYVCMKNMGNLLKWYQKAILWSFCKFLDLYFLIVNGFKKLISK